MEQYQYVVFDTKMNKYYSHTNRAWLKTPGRLYVRRADAEWRCRALLWGRPSNYEVHAIKIEDLGRIPLR